MTCPDCKTLSAELEELKERVRQLEDKGKMGDVEWVPPEPSESRLHSTTCTQGVSYREETK